MLSHGGSNVGSIDLYDLNLRCKLDFRVYAIYVLEKLFFSCRVQDDTSVIHILLPHFGRILDSVDGFHFKG